MIELIFSLIAMLLGAGGLLLAYRVTMKKPKWLDSVLDKYLFQDESGEWQVAPELHRFLIKTVDSIALHFIKGVLHSEEVQDVLKEQTDKFVARFTGAIKKELREIGEELAGENG